jgi:hypothetical protein
VIHRRHYRRRGSVDNLLVAFFVLRASFCAILVGGDDVVVEVWL